MCLNTIWRSLTFASNSCLNWICITIHGRRISERTVFRGTVCNSRQYYEIIIPENISFFWLCVCCFYHFLSKYPSFDKEKTQINHFFYLSTKNKKKKQKKNKNQIIGEHFLSFDKKQKQKKTTTTSTTTTTTTTTTTKKTKTKKKQKTKQKTKKETNK